MYTRPCVYVKVPQIPYICTHVPVCMLRCLKYHTYVHTSSCVCTRNQITIGVYICLWACLHGASCTIHMYTHPRVCVLGASWILNMYIRPQVCVEVHGASCTIRMCNMSSCVFALYLMHYTYCMCYLFLHVRAQCLMHHAYVHAVFCVSKLCFIHYA